jgi:hypothetical protein
MTSTPRTIEYHVAEPKAGIKAADDCPDAAEHTPMPSGYIGWHAVAEKRTEAGQRQTRCPSCGFLARWFGGKDVPGWPRRPR